MTQEQIDLLVAAATDEWRVFFSKEGYGAILWRVRSMDGTRWLMPGAAFTSSRGYYIAGSTYSTEVKKLWAEFRAFLRVELTYKSTEQMFGEVVKTETMPPKKGFQLWLYNKIT